MAARNMTQRVEGSKLIIEIDLNTNLGPSSTGKSDLVASSGGFEAVPGVEGVSVSLNVSRKKQK